MLAVAPAFPGPGALDPSFGTGGKLTTTFGALTGEGTAVALQPDGKIVVVGHYSGQFAVARYNADGSLDSTFDGDGKLTTTVGTGGDAQAWAVALQPDGKIVAAGYSSNGANYDFALVRYSADGSVDTTFGVNGIVTTAPGSGNDELYALALQSDGKLVAAGRSTTGSGTTDLAVARYNSDGSPDTTFGGSPGPGWVLLNLGSGDDAAFGVKVQPDGKIVAAGSGSNGTNLDVGVARFEPNGCMNATALTPIGSSDDEAYALALQPDGKIVVAGRRSDGTNDDFALVRYQSNLTLDPSFDYDGKTTTPITGDDEAWSLAVQPDGKLLAAGLAGSYDFALARYQTDGSLDTAFGTGGKVTTSFGSLDYGYGSALQPDGKIVVAGAAVTDHTVWGVARYVADGTAPGNPGVTSPSHAVGAWSADPTVDVDVTGATDDWSGVDGFSYQWSQSETTTPDTTKDAEEALGSTTSSGLADGSWWFHLRTGDNAGNWSGVVSHGPFRIDTTAPVSPALSSPSHTFGAWSANSTPAVAWSGASDGGSGVDGFSYEWSQSPTTTPDTTKDAEQTADGLSSARPDGTWWFHLRTGDAAGNWSEPVHLGPFSIDATAPGDVNVAALSPFQTVRSFNVEWTGTDPAASFDVRYRHAALGGRFEPAVAWKSAETATGASLNALPGSTYCLSARAVDSAGNQGSFGREMCTAIPANLSVLFRKGSWVRKYRRGHYLGSYLTGKRRGDSLSVRVSAKRLALVATMCPRCGVVDVYVGKRRLRRISLDAKSTSKKQLIHVASFAGVRTGNVRITIVSDKKPVLVEGLGASRV